MATPRRGARRSRRGAAGLFTKPIDFPELRAKSTAGSKRRGFGMTAKILVVDDEPDLEDLVTQKFRRQIRDGSFSFLFARDGVEALAFIAANRDIDMVVSDINMPRMDGLTLLGKLQDEADEVLDHHRLGLWRHGQHPHRDEPRRIRFSHQADRLRRFRDDDPQDDRACRSAARARERQAAAERAHASLARYFSPNLARSLAADANALAPGGQRREIATLFTDIAGFTPLVESLDTSELASLLSGYLEGMTEIVFAHEGTVAKIIGDAIHVLFGAPGDQPDAARRAIACALALDARAEAIPPGMERARRSARRHAHRRSRRAGDRRQFRRRTAVRLHRLWRHDQRRGAAGGGQQAAGHAHLRQRRRRRARRRFFGRPVGDLVLRGRSEPLRVFEPLSPERSVESANVAYLERLREAGGARSRRRRRPLPR